MDDDEEIGYPERTYTCPVCSRLGDGYHVGEQSPEAFFLQPHRLYPMKLKEFDRWVTVLRRNFPDHPILQRLGTTWYAGAE